MLLLPTLFLQSWGKGPGPFKRGKFPKLGEKLHNEQSLGIRNTKYGPKLAIKKGLYYCIHF